MMNIIGLCLVVSSLVTAGVWSPLQTATSASKDANDVIVKEGHRVVVVEYDKDDQTLTKVSISPETSQRPDVGGGGGGGGGGGEHWRSPKELICDAYGKCKHKIADAVGRAKDTVHDAEHAAMETVHGVEEAARRVGEKVRDGARCTEECALHAMKETKDLGKTIGLDVAGNVTGFMAKARIEAVAMAGFLTALVSPAALNPISGTLYMLAFCTAYGAGVWVTFALSHVLALALPRQQLGVVMSKVYQVYFRTMAVCLAAAAFWFVMMDRGKLSVGLLELLQVYVLLGSLSLVLVNAFVLEPMATKVMLEKMKLEKEEGKGREEVGSDGTPQPQPQPQPEMTELSGVRNRVTELNGKLKKLNTTSSFLNILTLMALSCHVFYIGHRLHMTV